MADRIDLDNDQPLLLFFTASETLIWSTAIQLLILRVSVSVRVRVCLCMAEEGVINKEFCVCLMAKLIVFRLFFTNKFIHLFLFPTVLHLTFYSVPNNVSTVSRCFISSYYIVSCLIMFKCEFYYRELRYFKNTDTCAIFCSSTVVK